MKLKMGVLTTMIAVAMVVAPLNVNAAVTARQYASGSWRFTDEWETSVIYKDGNTKVAKMAYGYDTDWWDEDYVWTRGYDCKTQASLTNGKGSFSGTKMSARMWSIIEVHHTSDYNIEYRIWMNDSYNNTEYKENEGVAG